MALQSTIIIGERYESFIKAQLETGKYKSVDEVVNIALQNMEQEEVQKNNLITALEVGEKSGKIYNFDRNEHLKKLQEAYNK